jgi:hypothetical protein
LAVRIRTIKNRLAWEYGFDYAFLMAGEIKFHLVATSNVLLSPAPDAIPNDAIGITDFMASAK